MATRFLFYIFITFKREFYYLYSTEHVCEHKQYFLMCVKTKIFIIYNIFRLFLNEFFVYSYNRRITLIKLNNKNKQKIMLLLIGWAALQRCHHYHSTFTVVIVVIVFHFNFFITFLIQFMYSEDIWSSQDTTRELCTNQLTHTHTLSQMWIFVFYFCIMCIEWVISDVSFFLFVQFFAILIWLFLLLQI